MITLAETASYTAEELGWKYKRFFVQENLWFSFGCLGGASFHENISLHWSQESLDIAQHWRVLILPPLHHHHHRRVLPRYCPGHHITQPPIKSGAAECEECKRQLRTAKPHPLTGQHHLYHHHHRHHHM